MSTSTRYCRHCLGMLRTSGLRATANLRAASTTAPAATARHYQTLRRSTSALFQQQQQLSTAPRQYLQRYSVFRRNTRSPHATFQTSARQQGAILNPRKDEDGNDMEVGITARASNRLKAIMDKDGNPDLALRVTVESGGCHGFQYLMSLTDMSKVDQQEDTVFEGDKGARVVMDEPSLELLKGSKVDYTMELIGSQFKIVDNPLATSSCGCGTSFDIKAA